MSNPSLQSQILAAAVAAFNGAGGVVAYRTRMTAFKASELPATNLLPDEEDAEYNDTDSIDRRFRFKVRHTAVAVDQVDVTVDAAYIGGQKALFADVTLGGLAYATREISKKWEFEKGELDTVALVVMYETQFSTTRSDPSVRFP